MSVLINIYRCFVTLTLGQNFDNILTGLRLDSLHAPKYSINGDCPLID